MLASTETSEGRRRGPARSTAPGAGMHATDRPGGAAGAAPGRTDDFDPVEPLLHGRRQEPPRRGPDPDLGHSRAPLPSVVALPARSLGRFRPGRARGTA